MKPFLFLIASCFSFNLLAQSSAYDEMLAKKLGADEYGMKQGELASMEGLWAIQVTHKTEEQSLESLERTSGG